MPEPCRANMCHTCARNFDKLIESIFRHLYPKVAVLKDTFDRYSMRNDSSKLTKIIQKFLHLNNLVDYETNLLFVFPNKHIDYEISHLENRISGNEGFRYDNTLADGEVYVQLPTILRATLCEECYQKYKHEVNLRKRFAQMYYKCSCVNSMFNYLVKGEHLIKYMDAKCKPGKPIFSNIVKAKLFEFKEEFHKIIHPDWKSSDYYFRKLFGVPIFLSGIIPREHFESLHRGYLNDVIAGHPMASNGWMQEAMDDMEEMGVF